MRKIKKGAIYISVILIATLLTFWGIPNGNKFYWVSAPIESKATMAVDNIPEWKGLPYAELNGNQPLFTEKQKRKKRAHISYSELDALGRPGLAFGCLCRETLSNGNRKGIGSIRPPGWETKKYPSIIRDRYVYNRCHLLMQAAAAGMDSDTCNGPRNLITGTRYMNMDGMLAYESELLSYLQSTNNHVLYRVSPKYKGKELVARGVIMEAWSIEDDGQGLHFNVYCYNVQPGIAIDYATGKTHEKKNAQSEIALALNAGAVTVAKNTDTPSDNTIVNEASSRSDVNKESTIYVLNKNTKRFHYPDCPSVNQINDKNREIGHYTRDELMSQGYVPCGNCKP